MDKKRQRRRTRSNASVIGGHWLPNLLIWGGTLLMLTGGVIAYPTIQNYLAPLDADSLEFRVTLTPPLTVVAVQATPQIAQPSACPNAQCEGGQNSVPEAAATSTPPPPLILPETKLIVEQETPTASEARADVEATPEATPAPSPSPLPMPTPDPASLMPTRLIIPAINLDAPVDKVGWETQEVSGKLVSSWIVPNYFAAGWHVTSALPGSPGNTVLNGHHNIYGEVFRDLEDLQPGDEIVVYSGDTPHYYAVTERHILKEKYEPEVVRLENAQFIMPTEDERLTMVTCWPYTNNTHRLIIVALPAQPAPTPTPMVE